MRAHPQSAVSDPFAPANCRLYFPSAEVPVREDIELHLITGADALAQLFSWRDVGDLFDLAHFVGVTRPGVDLNSPGDRGPTGGRQVLAGVGERDVDEEQGLSVSLRALEWSVMELRAPPCSWNLPAVKATWWRGAGPHRRRRRVRHP